VGFAGDAANGVPGHHSLAELASRTGLFTVVA
jgi:hypothetical protein